VNIIAVLYSALWGTEESCLSKSRPFLFPVKATCRWRRVRDVGVMLLALVTLRMTAMQSVLGSRSSWGSRQDISQCTVYCIPFVNHRAPTLEGVQVCMSSAYNSLFLFWGFIYTHYCKCKNFGPSRESKFTQLIFSHIKWWKEKLFLLPFGFWEGNFYHWAWDTRIFHEPEFSAGGSTFL